MKRIFLLFALIGFGYDARSQVVDTNRLENEEMWIRKQMQAHHIPYVGVGIIRKGALQQVKAYGEHVPGQPAPFNTIINVASLTKPVVAMLTLKLVNNGDWNLDDPLHKYWVDPDVRTDPRSKTLTTRHVLTHQTGFANWRWNHPAKKLTFDRDPGTQFGYSGEGFQYLKKALENKFGKKLERLVDSLVFKPLQMKDSYLVFDKRIDPSRVAAWHDTLGKPAYDNKIFPVANAADDLVTTVEDYGKFMVAVMNGFGLSKALHAEMIRPHALMKPEKYMGLGWAVNLNFLGNEPLINHEGADVGIRSLAFWLPDSKEGLIIFTNADNGYKLFKEMVEVRWRGSLAARPSVAFDQALAEELARMAQTDQIAAYIPQGKYKALSPAQWNAFRDSVFTTHQKRLAVIFDQYGFPGYDRVGKEGSKHFWLMVQHADHVPAFQQKVLEKMKTEVDKGNAEPSNYALLVDRVHLNTGKPQVYGTQVAYDNQICQAYPQPLADRASVNERRKRVGLPPLEEYLNQMTQMHFEMNKESYLKRGIKEPKLYKTEGAGN